jgi:hypothetical protein
MVDDLRLIDGALDLYAIENSKAAGNPASWTDLQPYLKKNMILYNSGGFDLLGNMINGDLTFSVDFVPKVSPRSFESLSDIAPREFWSPFDP